MQDFSSILLSWYKVYKRMLPWRENTNPYFIWLSEIILQQTRVEQGLPYFYAFKNSFPTVVDLANASEDDVFRLWQGLGYYRRAKNLHATAKMIRDDFGGVFPTTYDDLLKLKGVGPYTAAAIASFAYNIPVAAVDGNVYRILSRVFQIDEFIDSGKGQRYYQDLGNELIDKKHPADFNQAMMDFGSLQCVPKSPNCDICPFSLFCGALSSNKIAEYPKKKGKTKVSKRYLYYFDVRVNDSMFVRKREGNDIWHGLYEFPLLENASLLTFNDLQKEEKFFDLFPKDVKLEVVAEKSFKHRLSHQQIFATFYQLNLPAFNHDGYQEVSREELERLGLPRLITKYLEELGD